MLRLLESIGDVRDVLAVRLDADGALGPFDVGLGLANAARKHIEPFSLQLSQQVTGKRNTAQPPACVAIVFHLLDERSAFVAQQALRAALANEVRQTVSLRRVGRDSMR